MSIEVCLRDDCTVRAHRGHLNKSAVETLLFVGVCDTVCLKKIVLLTENFGEPSVQNGQILVLLSVVIKPFWRLNTNLDDNPYWRFYTLSRLSTGHGQQFRFAFIEEDDDSYRWSTISESANTTQKGVSTLAKNLQLFSYGNEMLLGQGYLTIVSQNFLSPV